MTSTDANPPLEPEGPLPGYEGWERVIRRVIREELEPVVHGLDDVRQRLQREPGR